MANSGEITATLDFFKGDKGNEGKSAYQVAVDNGFEGTEEEWLESLKGEFPLADRLAKGTADGAVEEGAILYNTAVGENSHAEGRFTTASGDNSHAEGSATSAAGECGHAEGTNTVATGDFSHAQGESTRAMNKAQSVGGRYNEADPSQNDPDEYGTYAEIIGNGTDSSNRSNARTLDWNGNETLAGKLTIGANPTNDMDVATKKYVDDNSGGGFDLSDRMAKGTDEYGDEVWGAVVIGQVGGQFSNKARRQYALAEGDETTASGQASHSEGNGTTASGQASHSEGTGTTASGPNSHAEGGGTAASGDTAHAEGGQTVASGNASHAEGGGTIAARLCQHVFGAYNVAETGSAVQRGTYVEIVGNGTAANSRSNARTLDWDGNEVLAGKLTVGAVPTNDMDVATKKYVDDHSGGSSFDLSDRMAKGTNSGAIIEGAISGNNANKASGSDAHAEGGNTTASGDCAHAEGSGTTASGVFSHAEGGGSTASGQIAHAEGAVTTASGSTSHAEGGNTTASGAFSHAEGNGTIANHKAQHVFGEFNASDPSNAAATERGTYVEVVGNGSASNSRSNARTLDWNGNEKLAGGLTLGMGTANEVTITAAQLQALLALLQ